MVNRRKAVTARLICGLQEVLYVADQSVRTGMIACAYRHHLNSAGTIPYRINLAAAYTRDRIYLLLVLGNVAAKGGRLEALKVSLV